MRHLLLIHDGLTRAGSWAAAAALAGIALASFVGTLSRYLAGMPIGWVPDWTGYLLAAAIFLAAPAVTQTRAHVAIEAVQILAPPGWARRLDIGVGLVAVATLLAISWIVLQSTLAAFRDGTGTAAGYPIPRWWLLSIVLYGFASSALHFMRIAWTSATAPAAAKAAVRTATR